MSLNKRFTGDFTIESIDSGSRIESHADGTILIGDATAVIPILDGVEGGRYKITTVGSTDFTLIGSDDNVIGTVFTMNAVVPLGTGEVILVSVLTVDGDLTVLGTATTINSIDTEIVDNIIVLNSGELGAGVTLGTSGLEIDRGSALAAGIHFNESTDTWQINNGDGIWTDIVVGSGFELVTDLSPQLGGALDVNGQIITSATGGDVVLTPDTNGNVLISTVGTGDVTVTSADTVSITAVTTATLSAAGAATLSSSAANVVISSVTDTAIASGTGLGITAGTDLVLAATGVFKIDHNVSLLEEAIPVVNPGFLIGYNTLSAGLVGDGGSGIYFVNDSITDELVSKKRAIAYSIIF